MVWILMQCGFQRWTISEYYKNVEKSLLPKCLTPMLTKKEVNEALRTLRPWMADMHDAQDTRVFQEDRRQITRQLDAAANRVPNLISRRVRDDQKSADDDKVKVDSLKAFL